VRSQARRAGPPAQLAGELRALRADGDGVTGPAETLDALRRDGLYRRRRVIESAQGARVTLDGREVLLMCSNDYLGLAGHPALRAAAAEAALEWGAGAGASALVSGHTALHEALEAELAAFKRAEACVLFGSGFLANTGVVATLAGPDDVILSDALNHASLIDGCRLARARTVVYPHLDMDALEAALARVPAGRAVIVTDAVFSMDGDLAPLEAIADLARRFAARVIVDEAHATGVVGPGGRGLVAELGLEGEIDVVVGTLGKALGSYGAFACCDAATAELLVNRARTMIFSTALPPPAVGAALRALQLLRAEPEIMDRLHDRARALRLSLRSAGLPVAEGAMPIVPLILGDATAAVAAGERALRDGVFVQAIRPPTVPPGTSRLRVVVTAAHGEDDVARAAACLATSVT
jgi:glycine C-acetyltransferase/8-amino-7-oxononanoate synthase